MRLTPIEDCAGVTALLPPRAGELEPTSVRPAAEMARRRLGSTPLRSAVDVPRGVFVRSRWQDGYLFKLRITDFLVVCAAVNLAQYLQLVDGRRPSHRREDVHRRAQQKGGVLDDVPTM